MAPSALLTDLYELNMAASYLRRGMDQQATFSLFVRTIPPGRGFLVAAGLDPCLRFLETFRFEEDELAYLRDELGFDDPTIAAFRRMRFEGDVWAVPEGRIVFADEPLLEITAPIAIAQLVETFLLNQITFHTAIVGFVATSNVEAARRYDLRATGTMAHSYIESFPSEADAFRAFAEDFPERTTFLVDTYDTANGVRTAIEGIRELGLTENLAVRLDSGDLDGLSREARCTLDEAGLPQVKIFESGGLDEHDIHRLVEAGAPIDAFGIGTRLGVSADAPFLDSVYKLVEYDGRPVLKLSANKATEPGRKQVFRGSEGDVIGLRDEPRPDGAEPLLVPVMLGGKRVGPPRTLETARHLFESDLVRVPEPAKRTDVPEPPHARVSEALRDLTERVRSETLVRIRLDDA